MKSKATQLEILLMAGTTLLSNPWNAMNNPAESGITEKEQLAAACLNGALPETMPEIFSDEKDSGKLFIWQIREAPDGIEVEMGEFPEQKDPEHSILPGDFLSVQKYN